MGVRRFRPRLDVLSRQASDRDYRWLAEFRAPPDRAADAYARLYQRLVRLAAREKAAGVSLTELLDRLPRNLAEGIRQALARLALSEDGKAMLQNETG